MGFYTLSDKMFSYANVPLLNISFHFSRDKYFFDRDIRRYSSRSLIVDVNVCLNRN